MRNYYISLLLLLLFQGFNTRAQIVSLELYSEEEVKKVMEERIKSGEYTTLEGVWAATNETTIFKNKKRLWSKMYDSFYCVESASFAADDTFVL